MEQPSQSTRNESDCEVQLYNGLSKDEILRYDGAIDTLFARGRRGSVMPIRYVWRVNQETEQDGKQKESCVGEVRVLFSVPKKFFKRANKRNLLRRRMKESFRQAKHALRQRAKEQGVGIDIALIYSTKEVSDYTIVNNAVCRILEQIRERL